jgi:hypothetical protein
MEKNAVHIGWDTAWISERFYTQCPCWESNLGCPALSLTGAICRGRTLQQLCKLQGPVTGLEGPLGCETSRLIHFLDNTLIDGGEVVCLTHRPAALYHQEHSWYPFMLKGESTPGPQCGWWGLGQLQNPMMPWIGTEPETFQLVA